MLTNPRVDTLTKKQKSTKTNFVQHITSFINLNKKENVGI